MSDHDVEKGQGDVVAKNKLDAVPADVEVAAPVVPNDDVVDLPPAMAEESLKDDKSPGESESVTMRKVVKAVEVQGNKSIGLSTILAKIKTRVAQDYNSAMVSDDLKRLYNSGYFSDVSVDRKEFDGGYKVVFIVVEKEVVNQITFTKLKFLKPKGILNKLKTVKGKFLDRKTLNDDIRTIEELYAKKGLSQAKVTVETQRDELNNKINVHFVIKEGFRIKIKNIVMDGNTTFPRKRLLKVVKSRYAWLFNSGFLKNDVVEEDVERLKSFYEKEGFIDATATYDVEQLDDSNRLIKFHIYEGQRYYVEQVSLVGNVIISDEKSGQ